MGQIRRIEELNADYADKLEPYRGLGHSKFSIVNQNFGYFLGIGVACSLLGIFNSGNYTYSTEGTDVNAIFALLALAFVIFFAVAVSAWQINLYRAVVEKTANKNLKLTKSSFIPNLNKQFFARGGKFLASSIVFGLILGIIFGILIGVSIGILVATVGVSLTADSLSLGVFSFVFGIIAIIGLFLLLAVLVSPFMMALTPLYVYYGDSLGIGEAISLSFKLGIKNYWLFFKTAVKVTLFNALGILFFGVGFLYTSGWGILAEIDAVSSVLGVSLKEGHTFDSWYNTPKGGTAVVTEPTHTGVYPTREEELVTSVNGEEFTEYKVNAVDEDKNIVDETDNNSDNN